MSSAIVIGGGFFGCCAAVRLARAGVAVTLVERAAGLLSRASAVNQARVHTGYHYPRSFVTALRSFGNYRRFIEDFGPAIRDDFAMLYAISRHGSKVSAKRFHSMFSTMGAPIARAPDRHRRLFRPDCVEEVFTCEEFAFDHTVLQGILRTRLAEEGVSLMLSTGVAALSPCDGGVRLDLDTGTGMTAPLVLNATYGGINHLLGRSGQPILPLKFEVAEVALFRPPPELDGLGVTVMDGPFFSAMPYPARGLYSLTHVRHTPRASWTDASAPLDPDAVLGMVRNDSAAPLMRRDAAKLMPCMEEARLTGSLFEVKVVPQRNEADDGRPIIFHPHAAIPGLHSILGGKLDNVYDLEVAMEPLLPATHRGATAGRR